jgi:hypothetical protein
VLSLLAWAVEHWNVVQSRAVLAGLIGPNGAARVLDLPVVVLLALIEAIVAESEDGAKAIDAAYDEARPHPPPRRASAARSGAPKSTVSPTCRRSPHVIR